MKKSAQQRYLDNTLSCLLCTIYINGEPADDKSLAELERRLRSGIETAVARCHGGNIYYKTIPTGGHYE